MPFFSMFLNLYSEAVALEPAALTAFNVIKTFAESPAAVQIEAAAGQLFHLTATPGAAIVVEPKA